MTNPFHKSARDIESMDPRATIAKRIRHEGRIAESLVAAALAAGYTVSVYDSEEWTVKRSSDAATIIAALFSTDEDQLVMRDSERRKVAWFQLTYGNDGFDVIGDYSANDAAESLYAATNAARAKAERELS
jgi:hypothetical protein